MKVKEFQEDIKHIDLEEITDLLDFSKMELEHENENERNESMNDIPYSNDGKQTEMKNQQSSGLGQHR